MVAGALPDDSPNLHGGAHHHGFVETPQSRVTTRFVTALCPESPSSEPQSFLDGPLVACPERFAGPGTTRLASKGGACLRGMLVLPLSQPRQLVCDPCLNPVGTKPLRPTRYLTGHQAQGVGGHEVGNRRNFVGGE